MKNKNINLLTVLLTPLPLDMKKSSARRRFLRHIKGYKEDYDLEGEEIRKKYSEKGADGGHKTVKDVIQFSMENRKKADAEFSKLNDLEIEIDWTGETEDKDVVREIVQNEYDKLFILTEAEKEAGLKEKELNDNVFEFSETLLEIVKELE